MSNKIEHLLETASRESLVKALRRALLTLECVGYEHVIQDIGRILRERDSADSVSDGGSSTASGVSLTKPTASPPTEPSDTERLEHLFRTAHQVPVSGTFYFDGIPNGKVLSRESIDSAMKAERFCPCR